MKKTTITTELKAARDKNGELIGFRVWRLEPQYYIPKSMVTSYHKSDEEDDMYTVALTLPETAIRALSSPDEYTILDINTGVAFQRNDDILYSATDARAALFWFLEVRGGIRIKRKRKQAKRN